jgi:hypothetical protein
VVAFRYVFSGFHAYVSERGPFTLVFLEYFVIVSVKGFVFMGKQWVGIIVKNVVADVYCVSVFFFV